DFGGLAGLDLDGFCGGIGVVGVFAAGEGGDDVVAGGGGGEGEGGVGIEATAGAPFAGLVAALGVDGDLGAGVGLALGAHDSSFNRAGGGDAQLEIVRRRFVRGEDVERSEVFRVGVKVEGAGGQTGD